MFGRNISVIIPAYNEAGRIAGTLRDVMKNVTNLHEIIVVFDGNDSTPEIVKSTCPEAKVLHFTKRLGKGKAIVEGINEATGDVVAYMDADGAIPASELERLKSFLRKDNFVVSSRWSSDAIVEVKQPLKRILLGRVFHYFVFLVFRMPLKDTQCGLKLFNTKDAKLVVQKVRVFDWSFDISMIYHAMEIGLIPTEVGITWKHYGDSKLSVVRTVPRMFFSVIIMWVINKHDKSLRVRKLLNTIQAKLFWQTE